ncbi:hypothetical protein A1R12_10095 [Bacillus amyloliquefaciens]|nr:hypothetical protein A1R12_10095 [Bacillus amyloliquefaciens]KFI17624.1 hypothetical protein IO97_04405 [Bacillus velezensis]
MVKEVLLLNPLLRKTFHVLSLIGTFMFVFGGLYLFQKYTIGLLLSLNELKIQNFPIHVLIYTFTTLLFMKRYVKLSTPYQ